jgi:hypothetical protein
MAIFVQDVVNGVDVIRPASATLTGAWIFPVGLMRLNCVRASRMLSREAHASHLNILEKWPCRV